MIKVVLLLSLICLLGIFSLQWSDGDFSQPNSPSVAIGQGADDVFDHSEFDAVLKEYVDETGLVDYTGLQINEEKLDLYLASLDSFEPSLLGEDERLAFWLNVYNAYTLKLILNNYPIDSIRNAASGIFIPKLNTPWQVKLVRVGGQLLDLDHVEHKIVRKEFKEPRAHFALVCAARSCPKLRREAYTGEMLDKQLHKQGLDFFGTPSKNVVEKDGRVLRISKIFKWFSGDFKTNDISLQQFLSQYFEGQMADDLKANRVKIMYTDYDWSLNDASSRKRS